jgi:hypothetical protein
VILDPNIEEFERMKNAEITETPIIYNTRVHSDVFKTFNVPLGYMSSIAGGVEGLYLEEEFNIKSDEIIGAGLSREALSVTTINIALAHFLGCSPIILSGVDLAYLDKKRYSPGIIEKNNNIVVNEDDVGDILIEKSNKILSSIKWVMEADAISSYKKDLSLNMINTSKEGLGFDGIDFKSLGDVYKDISKQGDIQKILSREISKAFLNISKENISDFKDKLEKSFLRSKEYILNIKDELEKLKDGENESPVIILAKRDLYKEIAYIYFLVKPKNALSKYLDRYYKPWQKDFKNKMKLQFDFWDNFNKIADLYIKNIN